MATMQNVMVGTLCLLLVITGFYQVFGDYYNKNGVTSNLPLSNINSTSAFNYVNTWGNQTSQSLANAQAIPFFGGSFMLLTGAFQSLTLLVNFPAAVLFPLANTLLTTLGIPAWLTAFLIAIIVLVTMIYLLHAFGIGGL